MSKKFETAMNPARAVEAFEERALPHLNDLFRTARRLLRDRAQAESYGNRRTELATQTRQHRKAVQAVS
jgi:hypothetical protein